MSKLDDATTNYQAASKSIHDLQQQHPSARTIPLAGRRLTLFIALDLDPHSLPFDLRRLDDNLSFDREEAEALMAALQEYLT